MKSINEMTLTSSASHRTTNLANWLNGKHSLLSALLGCRVSHLSFVGILLFALFSVGALILATDAVCEYGWAAFCGLLAIHAALPLVNEMMKGGNRHD